MRVKHYLLAAVTLAASLFAGQAMAQETTYTFTSSLYDAFIPAQNCTVGECASYTTAQRLTITLTYAQPLAPNLPFADRSTDLIAYSMNDGFRTTIGPGPNASNNTVNIGTDATGMPNIYAIEIYRTPGPPYTINTPLDPNSRISIGAISVNSSITFNNLVCHARLSAPAYPYGPGQCTVASSDASSSDAYSNQPTVVTMAQVTPIPTLSEWALILFAGLLSGGAALILTRRKSINLRA